MLSRKHCLLPTDRFYEWQVQTTENDWFGKASTGKVKPDKQLFRIALKNDKLFSFAGLNDNWVDNAMGTNKTYWKRV